MKEKRGREGGREGVGEGRLRKRIDCGQIEVESSLPFPGGCEKESMVARSRSNRSNQIQPKNYSQESVAAQIDVWPITVKIRFKRSNRGQVGFGRTVVSPAGDAAPPAGKPAGVLLLRNERYGTRELIHVSTPCIF